MTRARHSRAEVGKLNLSKGNGYCPSRAKGHTVFNYVPFSQPRLILGYKLSATKTFRLGKMRWARVTCAAASRRHPVLEEGNILPYRVSPGKQDAFPLAPKCLSQTCQLAREEEEDTSQMRHSSMSGLL